MVLAPEAPGMVMVNEERQLGESKLSQWMGPMVALRTWEEVRFDSTFTIAR